MLLVYVLRGETCHSDDGSRRVPTPPNAVAQAATWRNHTLSSFHVHLGRHNCVSIRWASMCLYSKTKACLAHLRTQAMLYWEAIKALPPRTWVQPASPPAASPVFFGHFLHEHQNSLSQPLILLLQPLTLSISEANGIFLERVAPRACCLLWDRRWAAGHAVPPYPSPAVRPRNPKGSIHALNYWISSHEHALQVSKLKLKIAQHDSSGSKMKEKEKNI